MTRRHTVGGGVLALVSALALPGCVADAGGEGSGPEYATPETRQAIERMIEAHGGYERWRDADAVSFDNYFFNPFWEQSGWSSPWWVSTEVFEQGTRRTYHDYPLWNARVGYDGEVVWADNYTQGNPATFQTHFFYDFVHLPWLTQDEGVTLGGPTTARLPGYDQDFITIEMGFDSVSRPGKTTRDRYRLYIDPQTHLLRGYEYWIGWPTMLEAMGVEGDVFGPMLRVHDQFTTVDGLVVPTLFHTMPPDGSVTYGHHAILNYSLDETFDETRLERPATGVIDPYPVRER